VKAANVTAKGKRILGGFLLVLGWFCVLAIPLAIFDMIQMLPEMSEPRWQPPAEGAGVSGGQFDLRMMVICPGPLGWLGGWGYLASLVWLPIAGWQAWRGRRAGTPFGFHERVLFTLIPVLVVVVQALLRLTPLRHAYPLF
jgi:hypothetical protein